MNKIKRVSLCFRMLFQIAFITLPILVILSWIKAPAPLLTMAGDIAINMIPHDYPILHPLSTTTHLLGFLVSMIPVTVTLFTLHYLIKLFGLYEKGEIFSLQNVNLIRNIGYTLFIGQLINPIYDVLISLTLTWNNPPGHRLASITVDQTNIGILLVAFMVILISWIMAEAYKLREEQQLTI
jgi:hypothetical protein